MGRKKLYDTTIRARLSRDSYERLKEFCEKADVKPSDLIRKTIDNIVSLNVEVIQKLTPENIKFEYDKSRGSFKMIFEDKEIEMDLEEFGKLSTELHEEYEKVTDKVLKKFVKIKKIK